ncbi:MAG: hypothetical protein AUK48_07405 [Oscillatoriales cyanobacterium CG2_30_44_21]|nr:MAG: hypothetical protein AUK48_07405 [Oscillatoriales cyanobacterium CG2_30_44_21]
MLTTISISLSAIKYESPKAIAFGFGFTAIANQTSHKNNFESIAKQRFQNYSYGAGLSAKRRKLCSTNSCY